jgi:hypothetical protein
MKRFFPCLWVVILVLVFSNSSQAQFPCNPADSVGTNCCGADSGDYGHSWDLGFCDTLHVVPWPETDTCFIAGADTICINDPGENFPCFLYVPLLVTHDSNTFYAQEYGFWIPDSIAAIAVPLAWTRTNPTAYCSLSTYWNENAMNPYDPRFPRSIWRHFHPSELGGNRMAWLAGQFQDLEWHAALHLASDSSWYYYGGDSAFTPPHMWLGLIRTSYTNRRWWEGDRTLLATLTFRIEDTMHVCLDSTWWPPYNRLMFFRPDGRGYVPRDEFPLPIWVGQPWVKVTSPNGGEGWCGGSTQAITWTAQYLADVKIEYSQTGGPPWRTIVSNTPNDGKYSWDIPPDSAFGTACRVKISDLHDYPSDISDSDFVIFKAGDPNSDDMVDVGDIIYLINYLFLNGSAPAALESGDVNLDGEVDIGDVVYLINFLFLDGAAPRC